jgi:hypothetical protein
MFSGISPKDVLSRPIFILQHFRAYNLRFFLVFALSNKISQNFNINIGFVIPLLHSLGFALIRLLAKPTINKNFIKWPSASIRFGHSGEFPGTVRKVVPVRSSAADTLFATKLDMLP